MSFRYQEESSPQDWVQSMADNMQSYAPEDFICGDVLLLHYDHEVRPGLGASTLGVHPDHRGRCEDEV